MTESPRSVGLGPPAGAIVVVGRDGSNPTTVADGHAPRWSPDGRWIICARLADVSPGELRRVRPDGTDDAAIALGRSDTLIFSPDGTEILYEGTGPDGPVTIFGQSLRPGAERRIIGPGRAPAWSPDGGAVAYESLSGELVVAAGKRRPEHPANRCSQDVSAGEWLARAPSAPGPRNERHPLGRCRRAAGPGISVQSTAAIESSPAAALPPDPLHRMAMGACRRSIGQQAELLRHIVGRRSSQGHSQWRAAQARLRPQPAARGQSADAR